MESTLVEEEMWEVERDEEREEGREVEQRNVHDINVIKRNDCLTVMRRSKH